MVVLENLRRKNHSHFSFFAMPSTSTLLLPTAPVYLLEKCVHIRQLNLYVHCSATETALSLRPYHIVLRVQNDTEEEEQESKQRLFQIPLDCQISADGTSESTSTTNASITNVRVHKMPTSHLISIPIATPNLTNDPIDDFPLPAEMITQNYSNLYCRQCSTSILKRSPTKCRGLPSTYWEELVELWYCHTINNAKLDAISRVSIEAIPSQLLVGIGTLVIHPLDINLDEYVIGQERDDEVYYRSRASGCSRQTSEVTVEDENIEEIPNEKEKAACRWRNFYCRSCSTLCGYILVESTSPSSTSSENNFMFEVCLFKHRISNVLPSQHSLAKQSVPRLLDRRSNQKALQEGAPFADYQSTPSCCSLFLSHYTIESYLAAELLASVESRFQYRFVLLRNYENEDEAQPEGTTRMIEIQMLNTDCSIRTDSWPLVHTTSTKSMAATCPVLKLGYAVISNNTDSESPNRLIKDPEPISLTSRDFDYVEYILNAHSACYPSEFRKYQHYNLSFLCRLNRHGVMEGR